MPNSNGSRPQSGQDPSLTGEVSATNSSREKAEFSATDGRQQPISPPSEPMQFRAIGLVQGKYKPSEERFNRGTLEVEDETQIDAVLLGQVMSLVKKYIDLERSYFWVVYPRTREKEQTLHLQIVGVWSADGFTPITGAETPQADSSQASEQSDSEQPSLEQPIEDGYFSVRGQIVYQANDKQLLYVKIQQTPRGSSSTSSRSSAGGRSSGRGDRDKSFKLKIIGTLPQKAIGYFWDLHVKREGNDLVLQSGTSIAAMPVQKNRRPQQGRPAARPFSKVPTPNSARPSRAFRPPEKPKLDKPDRAARPTPKPIKRQSKAD